MRRLTYSPKAYVFVRSNTQGGRIYNLSPDVVSGTVTRNVNDVSTAEVVLRNRFRKWLKDPDNHMSILMPMDMITIWLQRIAGKPIQVFTGYLDSVPYYQMYPGNTTIKATCTLKRLNCSYFDPGLEWFQQWFDSSSGWNINPETGEILNVSAQQSTNPQNKMTINDGGFANLTQRFMIDIAGWSPDNVIISDLPADLPKIAAGLYTKIQKDNAVTASFIEQLLQNIMGVSVSPITSQNQDMQSHQQQNTVRAIKAVASAKNIPLQIPVTAALLTSGLQPTYVKHENRATQQNDWGYGLYAMKPAITREQDRRSRNSVIIKEGNTIDGVDKSKLTNPTTATEVFLARMQKVNTATDTKSAQHRVHRYDAALKGDVAVMQKWIETALNRTFTADDFQSAFQQSKGVIAAFAHPTNFATTGVTGIPTPLGLTWGELRSGQNQGVAPSVLDAYDFSIYSKSYRQASDALAPYYWMAKKHYSGIHLENPGQPMTNTMVLGGSTTDLQSFFDGVKNHTEYDLITLSKTAGNATELITYKSGKKSGISRVPFEGGSTGQTGSQVILQVRSNAPYPRWTFVDTQTQSGASGGGDVQAGGSNSSAIGQFSVEDIGKIGFASAFLAHFTLTANFLESNSLFGYKALANDLLCFDGVKQFCQSSMRSFMSLPDGKFCAFYPDYFGAHGRKPYWYIYDIEITNGGVMLSDEQLATHVYTIGDTYAGDEQITAMDYIRSAGVVTIDMGILEGFIRPLQNQAQETKLVGMNENMGVIKTAADFVYHYGARVYKEEIPQIRNQYFEFLYAWQRFMQKWAATFQTDIEFTFQPEVMCGGIIGFPQHNLQMYCETVTHTWDYSSGFQTQATLSSPAAMSATHKGDIGSLPGMALAGGVNSVGTPAG